MTEKVQNETKTDQEQEFLKCALCNQSFKVGTALKRAGELKHLACMVKNGESLESQEGDIYLAR